MLKLLKERESLTKDVASLKATLKKKEQDLENLNRSIQYHGSLKDKYDLDPHHVIQTYLKTLRKLEQQGGIATIYIKIGDDLIGLSCLDREAYMPSYFVKEACLELKMRLHIYERDDHSVIFDIEKISTY